MVRRRPVFVLIGWSVKLQSFVSIAVSRDRSKIDSLADRLSMVAQSFWVIEAESMDEDAEEAAVRKQQFYCEDLDADLADHEARFAESNRRFRLN